MNKVEIKAHEYKVSDATWGPKGHNTIYTKNLNEDIAFSLVSPELQKIVLARQINHSQLKQMIEEINPNNIKKPVFDVRLIGGTAGAEKSEEYLQELMKSFVMIEEAVFDIKSNNTCTITHPNSCEVDCYNGELRELSCLGESMQ